jgi:hypothetical protein
MGKNFDVNDSSSLFHLSFSFEDPSNYQVIVPKGNFSGRSISVASANLGFQGYDKKKLLDSAVLSILSQIQRQYSENTQERIFTHVEIKMDKTKQLQISLTDKEGVVETLKADAELSQQIFSVVKIVNNSLGNGKVQQSRSHQVNQGVKETNAKPVDQEKVSKNDNKPTKNSEKKSFFPNTVNYSQKQSQTQQRRAAEKKKLEDEERNREVKRRKINHQEIDSEFNDREFRKRTE